MEAEPAGVQEGLKNLDGEAMFLQQMSNRALRGVVFFRQYTNK